MNSKELLFWKTWPFCIQTSKLALKLVKLSPFCIKETFRRRSWTGDKTINLMKSFRSVCIHSLLHFDFKIALTFYSIYLLKKFAKCKGFHILRSRSTSSHIVFNSIWIVLINNYFKFHSPMYIVLLQDLKVGLCRQIKSFVFLQIKRVSQKWIAYTSKLFLLSCSILLNSFSNFKWSFVLANNSQDKRSETFEISKPHFYYETWGC